MKIYAVNGSPRKTKNTERLLLQAIQGAADAIGAENAETELIHLYDYSYTGCRSCFACKRLNGKSYGKCAVRDGITEAIEKAAEADILLLGSPIYFANISGMMKNFLERLLFQYFVYDEGYSSLAPKKPEIGLIYSMNVKEAEMNALNYKEILNMNEFFIEKVFTKPEKIYVNDTYQFDDYSKYKVECFSESDKAKVREEEFPLDLERAYRMGNLLGKKATNLLTPR